MESLVECPHVSRVAWVRIPQMKQFQNVKPVLLARLVHQQRIRNAAIVHRVHTVQE